LHIGFLTSSYPRFAGDHAGCFVGELARSLQARGHHIEVCAPWDGKGPRRESDSGVEVRRFRVTPPGIGSRLFYGDGAPENLAASAIARAQVPMAAAAFLAQAATRGPGWDAMVSHWLAPAGLAGAAVRRLGGPRHVSVMHGGDVDLLAATAGGRVLARAARPGLDRVLAVSESVAVRARALLGNGAAGGTPAVDILPLPGAAIAHRPDHEEARQALGLPFAQPVALFLGRLAPIKGPGLLLSAAARVPELTLLVSGPGESRHLAAAAKRLGARLHLTGPADVELRELLFAAADLLVVPSLALLHRREGLPQVAREAAARGLPIVAADTGGLPEAVAEGAGLLFRPGDPHDLARAMQRILADRPGWTEQARRAAAAGGQPTGERAALIVEEALGVC